MHNVQKIIQNLKEGGFQNMRDLAWRLWTKSFRYFAALFAILSCFYVFFVWHKYLYNLDQDLPTATQEAEIRKAKVKFNEEGFDQAVFIIEQREQIFSDQGTKVKDIFFGGEAPRESTSQDLEQEDQSELSTDEAVDSPDIEVQNPFEAVSGEDL